MTSEELKKLLENSPEIKKMQKEFYKSLNEMEPKEKEEFLKSIKDLYFLLQNSGDKK